MPDSTDGADSTDGTRWFPQRHRAKTLAELAHHLGRDVAARHGDVTVTGVAQDSRRVRPGDLYAALAGQHHHGGRFVAEAAARGAVAVLTDSKGSVGPLVGARPLPTVVVRDPRAVLGPLASWLYDDPSAAMDVYGVTGTNGKTSTAHLLDAGLTATGRSTALLSGVVQRGPRGSRPAARTTPEASELQQALAAAREQGAVAAAVEVSSHGLALRRVDGTCFTAAVFTNLGRDHLDLHGDMESYRAAKAVLFEPERCALAVLGVDDEAGRWLAARARGPVVTFSATGGDADWRALDVRATARGTAFRAVGPGAELTVALRLLGAHQVDNALGALAALASTGVDPAAAVAGMEALDVVPGRLERVDAGQEFLALVDYVHNPSGQQRLFPYLRSLTSGRVVVVLGATGGRDGGKRAPLGHQAGAFADTVVVTDESPHGDDPTSLRDDVASGARAAGGARVIVEPDRARAFDLAVSLAEPGDVLVVAGRGHDPVQVLRGVAVDFDDRVVLRDALRRRVVAS